MEKGRWPLALVIVLLSLIITAYVAMAHLVFVYQAGITVEPVSSPITVIPGQCPCGCSSWSQTLSGFSTTITAYTLETTSGYVLTTPLVKFNSSVSGTLTMSLSSSSSVVSDYVNGTQIYPSPGSFSLSAGSYLMIQRLALSSPVTSTLTLSGQYSYTYTPGVSFLYSFSETINPPSANVMNLLNGQNAIYVKHVYQGDYQGSSNSSWPVYYGPSTASQYWSPLSSSINQPVLMMVPSNYSWSSGAMFWQNSYGGGSLTITMVGVYSYNGIPSTSSVYPYVGDGYIVYLFLKPSLWNISPQYNYSVPYVASPNTTQVIAPVQGDVMFPQSTSTYIVVEWNPLWQYAYNTTGATGQWDVWLAQVTVNWFGLFGLLTAYVSPYPSPNIGYPYTGWDGIGTGAFQPRPGDYICITVTYNPSTNTLSGVAYDMNTGWSASFTLNLSGYFTPPGSGNYVFGVAGTNGAGQANWAIAYVNYQG
ncbi:hypothetical protein [Acidilobus sp. 7A]|uniref:hypothetical protein n=1 Tax=Acidilobus sp. 7A TaxID=1577685 RepID=UPI0011E4CC0D|nr:hypothetical protein [Acidilobus sp. 7A]